MKIKAFQGFRYNPDVVGDPGRCIAPPYDVIDADQQQRLYDQTEYNIVRVSKGKTFTADNESDNVYTRANVFLRDFLRRSHHQRWQPMDRPCSGF